MAEESEPEAIQEQTQSVKEPQSRSTRNEAIKTPGDAKASTIPTDSAPITQDDPAQTGASLVSAITQIDWGTALFICIISMLSATLFLWMRFAKYQHLGVIVNPYSITIIVLVGFTCFGLFMLGSNTYLSGEQSENPESYTSYLIAFGSAVVSNFFPAVGRLLNLRKKASASPDSDYVKNSLNYFYTQILLHIQSKMRAELIQYARHFDWKMIKRLLSRMVTDCLSTEIISDEKAQQLKDKINQYQKLDDEYDDIEAKYDAISTMLKEVHFKKVRSIFLEARG